MGVVSSCCTGGKQKMKINTDVIFNPHWVDACNTNNTDGIKMLHALDPDLINEPIDKYGTCAIHIAVQKKNGFAWKARAFWSLGKI